MKKIKQAKRISPMDIAKILGNEKEYSNILFEEELKRNYETIMKEDFDKNNKKT